MLPKNHKYLFIVPQIVLTTVAVSTIGGASGLPIDDAYIFMRYSSNLAHGLGYSFNPHETSFGVTSFIWAILNAAIIKIIPSISFQWSSQAMGIFFAAIAIFFTQLWAYKETKNALIALAAATLCAVSPMTFMNSVSGMETCLFVAGVVVVLYFYRFHGLRYAPLMGLGCGVVFLTRPEGLLIPVEIFLIELWLAVREKDVNRAKKIPTFLLGFLMVFFAFTAFTVIYGAGFMPTTFYGKIASSSGCLKGGLLLKILVAVVFTVKGIMRTTVSFGYVGGFILAPAIIFALENASRFLSLRGSTIASKRYVPAIIFVAILAVVAQCWKGGGSGKLLIVLLISAFAAMVYIFIGSMAQNRKGERLDLSALQESAGDAALTGVLFLPTIHGIAFRVNPIFGGYYNRYIAVLIPVILLLAVKGVAAFFPSLDGRRMKIIFYAVLVYAVVFAGLGWKEGRAVYVQEVSFNEGLRSEAAEWIKNNTPKDSVVMAGYTGLGVVGSRCDRYVVDLGALINKDIIPFYKDVRSCQPADRWSQTVAYMRKRGVSYYVTMQNDKSSDPHANPNGQADFNLMKTLTDPSRKAPVNTITIWKVSFN